MKIIIPILSTLLIGLWGAEVSGQHCNFDNLKFTHLDADNGLPMGYCSYMHTDSKGYFWFVTESAVIKYNGFEGKVYRFQIKNQANRVNIGRISAVCEDRYQNLWFAFESGIGSYDRIHDSLTGFRCPWVKDEHVFTQINLVAILNDSILIGQYLGQPFFFNTKTKKYIKVDFKTYNTAVFRSKKRLLLGAKYGIDNENYGFQLELYNPADSGTVTYRFFEKGNKHGQPSIKTYNWELQDDSIIWWSTQSGFIRFNYRNLTYEIMTIGDNLFPNTFKIFNRYLIATTQSGLIVFDTQTKRIINHIKPDLRNPYSVSDSLLIINGIDQFGNLFLSVNFKGVNITNLYSPKFKHLFGREWSMQHGTDAFVRCMVSDTLNRTWVGTMNGGIVVLDINNQPIKIFKHDNRNQNSIPYNSIEHLMLDNKNRVWVTTSKGLCVINEQFKVKNLLHQTFKADQELFFIFTLQTTDKRIFVTKYQQGIFEIKENGNEFAFDTVLAKGGNKYYGLYELSNGNVLVSDDELLMILKKQTDSRFALHKYLSLNAMAKCVLEEDSSGYFFVATTNGLFRVNSRNYSFNQYTSDNGLPDNYLYAIVADNKKNYWLSSNKGLAMLTPLSPALSNNGFRFSVKKYSIRDGLQGNEFNTNAFLKKDNGEIWFGGINGINIITENTYSLSLRKSYLHLSSLLINDEPFKSDSSIDEKKYLSFSNDQNTFSLRFSATDLINPAECKIQYKLDGHDARWTLADNPGLLRYSNLNEGTYTLKLRVSNSDGKWNAGEKNIKIIIPPPWFRTWWFYVIVFCSITLAVYAFIYFRIRDIRQKEKLKLQVMIETQEEERKRIGRDLHDDVGAQLSTLKLFLNSLKDKEGDERKKLYNESMDVLSTSVGDIRNILVNLSPKSLDEHGYVVAVEELVNRINKSDFLKFELSIHGFDSRLDSKIENALYRITQELINNTLKYAKAKKTILDVLKHENKITLMYEDDGIGCNLNEVMNGYGLTNIKTRAQMFNGSVEFDSSVGNGFRCVCRVSC